MIGAVAIHEEVLRAAQRIASGRGDWTFAPAEVVLALPHLNARSVRTHVVSRCCVNAPKHHPHRWGYFRRVGRARYQILPQYRRASGRSQKSPNQQAAGAAVPQSRVSEVRGQYALVGRQEPLEVIHAVVSRDRQTYVAECLEIAAVTQARTFDELITNLEEAITLHLEGQDPVSSGLSASPRLSIIFEVPLQVHGRKA